MMIGLDLLGGKGPAVRGVEVKTNARDRAGRLRGVREIGSDRATITATDPSRNTGRGITLIVATRRLRDDLGEDDPLVPELGALISVR
jgi:hypothetical protein